MSTTITEPDTQLDWTDQVRAVARFISDHGLPVISLEARPEPSLGSDDCHVLVHVSAVTWATWQQTLDRVLDEHSHEPKNCVGSVFHYVVALVAGVRVQVLHITDVESAVA